MADVVWWEVETPEPERFQEFHGSLWGWTFEAAFAGTELNAGYWLIRVLVGRGLSLAPGGIAEAAGFGPRVALGRW